MNANHVHDLKEMLYKITDKNSHWAVKQKVLSKSLWRGPRLQILVKSVKQEVSLETCNPQAPPVGHHWQQDTG